MDNFPKKNWVLSPSVRVKSQLPKLVIEFLNMEVKNGDKQN
ncbi:hypothetical protein SAMN05443550_1331 [Pedobacter hartonius]|uniref:Uncharacterized protein n=1 Tax=Pedobacter hartonius TaxID=425514 RepID=A0A1H4HKJ1_9SPHI|nr:hypothetical protein SAMN05443550_1331 [Pedobacter hartonius]